MISTITFVLKLLNTLPIFHISNDDNFGTYNNFSTARLSLFSIPLGTNIIYVISLNRVNNKFNFFKCISFDELQSRVEPSEVEEKVKSYELYLRTSTNLQQIQQEEFLKIRIAESIGSLYSLHNKVSFYSTIGLALFGFLGFLLTEIVNFKTFFYIKLSPYFLWGLSLVYATNLTLFIKKAIAVSSFYKSSFGDLKKNSKETALSTAFYRDWYDIKDAVRYYASLVKNIEKYLYRLIGACILTWLSIFILSNFFSYTYDYYIVYLQTHFPTFIS